MTTIHTEHSTVETRIDTEGRRWTYDPGLHSWVCAEDGPYLLRSREHLEDEFGPTHPDTNTELEPDDRRGDGAGWFAPTIPPAPACEVCAGEAVGPCHCRAAAPVTAGPPVHSRHADTTPVTVP